MLSDGVITLRPPTDGDVDALWQACQDPEIQRWTGVPTPYHREHAVAFLERIRAEEAAGRTAQFLAVDDADALLGSFSMMEMDRRAGYGEMGYWVAAGARGHGVATRAVSLLRDWAVAERGLESIELLIHIDNAPSGRVAERTGFLDTGELRKAPRSDGTGPEDFAVYAWSPA